MKRAFCLLVLWCATAAWAQIPPPTSFPSHHATVFGAKMHYFDVGSGPVVVLVHGLADEAGVWQQSVEPLVKAGYRVIVPDLIGFGKSDKPLLGYRTSTFTDFLQAMLRELQIEKATLVGNSLGGWVTVDFALRYPQQVAGVVIVCGVGFAGFNQRMPVSLENLRLSSRQQARAIIPYAFHDEKKWGTDEIVDGLLMQRVINGDGYTIDQFIGSVERGEDFYDGKLASVKAPALVVWGASDRLVPVSEGQRLAKEIAGAAWELIPDCGHMPQVECPADFNPVLLGWLAKQRAAK